VESLAGKAHSQNREIRDDEGEGDVDANNGRKESQRTIRREMPFVAIAKEKGKNGTTLRNYYTRVVLSRRGRRRVFSVSLNLYYHDAVSIMFPAPNVSPYIYCACSRIIGNERSRSFTASLRTRNNVSLLVSASFDHRQFDYRRLRHFAAAAQTSRLRCNR
jgi:hypothetical protein